MSLDKQRILKELSSVMNQLQGANCGCIGKMFDNHNPSNNNSYDMGTRMHSNHGTCRYSHNHQHHNHNHQLNGQNGFTNYTNSEHGHVSRDNSNVNNFNMESMGIPTNYNPVQLYSDTYKYLNKNLMQPVIQEVYNDLKTITPENTVMNNMSQQMGMSENSPVNNQIAGMGQGIVNMMNESKQNGRNSGNPMSPKSLPQNDIHSESNAEKPNLKQQAIPSSNFARRSNLPNQSFPAQLSGQNIHYSKDQNHTKFNQMVPGVVNKFRDLGFDPMAIAIQMNPENPNGGPAAAEAAIKKILDNNSKSLILKERIEPDLKTSSKSEKLALLQQVYAPNSDLSLNHETYANNNINQNILHNPGDKFELEPIHAVDTSKPPNVFCQYNTLGQPVELLPAEMYRIPQEGMPQTLSPRPPPIRKLISQNRLTIPKYSNVKNSQSRTSIMDQHLRRASKTQLNELYNRYKGSQSYTQQNIQPVIQKSTISDDQLYEPKLYKANTNRNVNSPLEKVAGDTVNSNRLEAKIEKVMAQNNAGDLLTTDHPKKYIQTTKGRNGLQDLRFTSYRPSPAWSFHG